MYRWTAARRIVAETTRPQPLRYLSVHCSPRLSQARTFASITNTASMKTDTSNFASGQQAPVFPADQPLALRNADYAPTHEGHPPEGTFPEGTLPEGVALPKLFESNTLPQSGLTLKNRVVVSPMCEYSSRDGFPTPYHLAHLGQFALHGVGTIMIEAAGVEARGRITPQDLGLYRPKEHGAAYAALISSLKTMSAGLTVGVQLAHAGRKGSEWSPYHRGERKNPKIVTVAEGGWDNDVVAPSAIAYDSEEQGGSGSKGYHVPRELTTDEVEKIRDAFVQGADTCFAAGADFVEIHAAHGYLLHSFLSPLSNKRTDRYGGSFENRVRLLLEICEAIHAKYPRKSLWVRVSSTDFAEHLEEKLGKDSTWNIEQTKRLAPLLVKAGVEVLDCSGGGLVSVQAIKPRSAYQLEYAAAVSALKVPELVIGSVGMLEGDEFAGQVAEKALQDGKAQLILLARGLLANPKWVEEAAVELTGTRCACHPAYHRIHPAKAPASKANGGARI